MDTKKEWAAYKILQVPIITATEDCLFWGTSIYMTRIKWQQQSAQEHLELYTNSALFPYNFCPFPLETLLQHQQAGLASTTAVVDECVCGNKWAICLKFSFSSGKIEQRLVLQSPVPSPVKMLQLWEQWQKLTPPNHFDYATRSLPVQMSHNTSVQTF